MSDSIVKLIPRNHRLKVTAEKASKIAEYLQSAITSDRIDYERSETPQFVDCGSNLDIIRCPVCGAELSMDWWGTEMDRAYENHFEDLDVALPCCRKRSTLNDLKYHFLCGFSCVEFDILNPAAELDKQIIKRTEELLQSEIQVIHAYL